MFKTILVPLDGTAQSAAALPLARALARVSNSRVVLIRVAASPAEREEAEAYLRRVAEELARSELTVTTTVSIGVDVGTQILWQVREQHADVVIMATHGRSGIQRAVMSSVSESVMTDSPAPVLLVRPGGKRTTAVRTLLVPVDGTAGGALALGNAIALAQASGARIVLLEVAVPIPQWLYSADLGGAFTIPVSAEWDDEALASATTYVEGLAKRLRDIGLEVEARAQIGDVVAIINAVADDVDADLIVIATHARVGVARAVLGSTADAVVRTSHRPVLLVRRSNQADADHLTPASSRSSTSA
jgi:nucleotide-binding universal stress UspA family protein